MRPLDLDFHPRPFSPAGIALLVAGLAAVTAVGMDYQAVAADVAAGQEELARLQRPERRLPASLTGDDSQLQQAIQAASAVAQDIRRPWDALFTSLEAAKTDEIALLTLNPDAARGTVQISGEAKQREAILAFVTRLGQGSVLRNVVLVEDQQVVQDAEKPFRFLLSAEWAGPST